MYPYQNPDRIELRAMGTSRARFRIVLVSPTAHR